MSATPAGQTLAGSGALARRGAPPKEKESGSWQSIFSTVQKVALAFIVTQLFTNYILPKPAMNTPSPLSPSDGKPEIELAPGQLDPFTLPPESIYPAWPLGINLDMHIYLSTSPIGDVFGVTKRKNWGRAAEGVLPNVVWKDIGYGVWDETRSVEWVVDIPQEVQRNASLWADVFVTKDGASPNPTDPKYDPANVSHTRKLLTRYLPKRKVRKEKNLLGGTTANPDEPEEEDQPVEQEIGSFWHRNLTLGLISDPPKIALKTITVPIAPYIQVTGQRSKSGKESYYLPVVYPNDFWQLREQLVEINTTTTQLPLRVEFQAMQYWKFQVFSSMSVGFEEAAKKGQGASEIDEIKRMLVETNPWFLALTGIVSCLHILFEFLAFKNDVSHWRKKNQMVGVSVRTIVTNVVVQIVILLYLIDNNTDTSWMILMGQGMSIFIEAWKVTKAVDISFGPAPAGSSLPWQLEIKDKHVLSEDEKKTQEYDALAFRYVSYVTTPTLLAYTVYSLVYETHRGWYSFIISTLTSFVYMFGFVQLVPQLIINYKLKSVAHMPIKAMIYKTLSTVVDDFFAFCIKMPWLHRLACFRDDVVFLIFIYQRWIYRIDTSRVNEYGQVVDEKETIKNEEGETKKDK